jgi:response regulator RpfG family c-di-GMP phosphodiesterase
MAMRVPATARGLEEAVEEIRSGKGRLYDAAVMEACLRVIGRSGFSLEAK